ncbi:MAG: GspH/FimT family pseudopilin [Nitrospirales bacterium]|nr:GspH/FimT family pseudopilin [Nitrospira sp.]MDR4501269.1 GspH/FimT family pseudopilin [Nitrospirales bacterium]
MTGDRLFNSGERDGYSLIELVIVLGILGIVLLFGQTWLMSQIPKWRLNGAVRQVVSDFMAAKTQAVTQGNKHGIRFLDDYRYSILDDDNNDGKPDPNERLIVRDIRTDYDGVMIASTNHPIFHPRGTASNLATITLSNTAGSKVVTVGITGRVSVKS